MKRLSAVCLAILALASLASKEAKAATILDLTSALALSNSTQIGRLSRNNISQDWGGSEVFPGVINSSTAYHYQSFNVNVGNTPYIQISVDSVSLNTFVSAYDASYLPDSAGGPNFGFDTHWLGDAGSSGNFFGTDPIFFQVYVPMNDKLVLVVNQTSTGTSGIGDPFHLTVEGFVDSQFTDPPTVPEPSTIFLSCGVLLVLYLAQRDSAKRDSELAPSACISKIRRAFSVTTR